MLTFYWYACYSQVLCKVDSSMTNLKFRQMLVLLIIVLATHLWIDGY